jgi:hypothetical protein
MRHRCANERFANLEVEIVAAQLQVLNPQDVLRILSRDQRLVSLCLSLQDRIPKQIPLSPVLVIDARGGNLPFHLETISSKEVVESCSTTVVFGGLIIVVALCSCTQNEI